MYPGLQKEMVDICTKFTANYDSELLKHMNSQCPDSLDLNKPFTFELNVKEMKSKDAKGGLSKISESMKKKRMQLLLSYNESFCSLLKLLPF